MTSPIRVPESVQSLVISPMAHNFSSLFILLMTINRKTEKFKTVPIAIGIKVNVNLDRRGTYFYILNLDFCCFVVRI
jgi:hypothetical protein